MTHSRTDGIGGDAAQRTLVYVAGYGRSGSTLLGRLMASTGRVLDVGEVAMAPRYLCRNRARCSCGCTMATCPIWGRIPQDLRSLPRRRANRHDHVALLRAILNVSEQPAVVDSSKTAAGLAFRPAFLSRHLPVRLRLIHLVRDPRAVVWSVVRHHQARRGKPSGWRDIGVAIKTSLVWQAANLAAELQALWFSPDVVRLRYDHLVRFGTQDKLQGILPYGALEGLTHDSGSGDYHSLGGNRMRKNKNLTVRLDDSWRSQMPRHLLAVATTLSLPFIIRYRFGVRTEGAR